MSSPRAQRRITARLNLLVDIIRKDKTITFAELCLKGDLAPSTLHAYKLLLMERYPEIGYKEGVFYIRVT